MADSDQTFGSWLKRLRFELDVTQERFAEQVGCSVETVRAFESGRRRPSRAMAERLAQVLGLPQDQQDLFLRLARNAAERLPAPPPAPMVQQPVPPSQRTKRVTLPPTALIGRAAEQAELRRRLGDASCRLVTIIGPGGSGKTRLALQMAADMADSFADGAAFVNLTSVAVAAQVPVAIADALGLTLGSGLDPDTALVAALAERELLLTLDNLEHLLDATPLLAAIVRDAPRVRLLVTSRERLRLREEWVLPLDGLALPRDDSRAAVERSDAALLFLDRAQRVADDFALSPANREAVTRICRLLDGMPLGIELAATWLRVLAPEEIVVELARDIDFLALSDRDADPRHKSMRAVFDHSWRLLTAEEQRTLARLSIFRGGCMREAAAQVAGASLPVLASLIDKSLLRRTAAGRYELHELVRQYAEGRLADDPEADKLHERHCDYYAAWIKGRTPLLKSQQQHLAVAEISAEIDNMRAACIYALDNRRIAPLMLMFSGSSLAWFYELKSWYREGEALCRHAVTALSEPPPTSRDEEMLLANQMGIWGWYTFRRGDPARGLELLEASLKVLRAGDHPEFLFYTLEQLAYLRSFNGDFAQAVALAEEAVAVVQRIDDRWIHTHALFISAVVFANHQPMVAYERFHAGLPRIRAVGDRNVLSLTLNHLGEVALLLGKMEEAEGVFAEAMRASAEVGNGIGELSALNGLARVACARGAWREAITRGLEAVNRAREVGDIWGQGRALITLGEAEAGAGDVRAASRTFAAAIRVSLTVGALPTAIDAFVALAALDTADASRHKQLLPLLALVRDHPTAHRHSAERAKTLLQTLIGVEEGAIPALGALTMLLAEYAEGREG